MELLELTQAGVGWAMLAARAPHSRAEAGPSKIGDEAKAPEAAAPPPLRLRATITIDIDARTPAEAEQGQAAIRAEYDRLQQGMPGATLEIRRRKPRTGRRPAAPLTVVSPYVDD